MHRVVERTVDSGDRTFSLRADPSPDDHYFLDATGTWAHRPLPAEALEGHAQ
jgi:hypothetical protein